MRIAFDLRRIGNPGIGRYMRCLVESIVREGPQNEYLLILPREWKGKLEVPGGYVHKQPVDIRYYSLQEQFALPSLLRKMGADLLHSPHFLLPLVRPCPAIVTIHDVIYIACKEDLPSRVGRLYYRLMIAAAARLSTRIITDSQFSKREIVRYLKVNPEKIAVLHCGIDDCFQPIRDAGVLERVRMRYGIREEYVLYTSIYRPRKRHAELLRAFHLLIQDGVRSQLVFAGPTDGNEASLRRLAAEFGIADHVVFTGFCPDEDLPALYSAARLYACPSTYEGFGFTVLEAMACGVPVVCAPEASLPEVAGDAALYTDPRQPQKFADAMSRAFTDEALRQELITRGYKNAARFSWQRTAQQTLQLYQDTGPRGSNGVGPA